MLSLLFFYFIILLTHKKQLERIGFMNMLCKGKNLTKLLDETKPFFIESNYIHIQNYDLYKPEILNIGSDTIFGISEIDELIREKIIKWTNPDGLTDLAEIRSHHGLLTKSDIYVLLNISLLEDSSEKNRKVFDSSNLLSIMNIDKNNNPKIYHLKIRFAIEKMHTLALYINTHEYITIEGTKLTAEKKSGFVLVPYRQVSPNKNNSYNFEINFSEEFTKDMLFIMDLLLKAAP
jgi:hypothetical protein